MKQIRAIRILAAALFFAASVVCLIIGSKAHPLARTAGNLQILLSVASSTIGVTLVWLLITFLFGRIYCATVCPVGTLSDIFLTIRRKIPRLNKPFRYRPRSKWAIHILWIYLLCVLSGVMAIPFIIEPWNMARNIASAANPQAISDTWATIGLGTAVGVCAGIISAFALAIFGLWHGREFCTRFCPLGTALGFLQEYSIMHIEIDPDKCISCGKCEDNCRAQCVKVVSRYIDASRCVRCFECVANCPTGAIRYQINRNMRPASPLMRKTANSKQLP